MAKKQSETANRIARRFRGYSTNGPNLIQSRLSRLSDNARRILELAAVLGRQFTFEVIVQALPQSEGAILDALDELRTAVLIKVQDDEQYSFDHSLTMEVVYQGMTESRYRSLHRHVAQTLEKNLSRFPGAGSRRDRLSFCQGKPSHTRRRTRDQGRSIRFQSGGLDGGGHVLRAGA